MSQGTTKLHRHEENIGSVDIEFAVDELAEIDNVSSESKSRGKIS